MEDMAYKESIIQLNHEDKIFAYTDGIPEAHDVDGNFFSDDQLKKSLGRLSFMSSKNTVKSIIDEVELFAQGRDQFDDITALCLMYNNVNVVNN